ncbi:TonB-dependent receptor [Nitrospirillum iridis]|uniref:Iron complex outermembrane receptor protein n=1 Tax=Nitrospirillum iridis TaxID=765888 RepID=A0A7X0B282_9PROT|nr:TonB-dependent receptor [Nitrospirillum iridis]MBB6253056.1 iron complex outermembrane receptor protein [Nitrospirillum iridis]
MAATSAIAADEPSDKKKNEESMELQEIVVTARKREEDILKTPVSVAAITGAEIDQKGIVSINNLADQTAGLNINNNSSGRSDRSFQQIILRGFTPATTDSTPVATFIDGVPVSSPTAVMSVSNPERVELLRGPQSAYFGRNAFAGALNVVNKLPGNDYGGSVTAMVGTHNNRRLQAEVDGPIVDDKVGFRIGADHYSKDGSYKNAANPSQTLGDQSSTSGNALLTVKPTENLSIKAFGLISHDDDGPAAMGLLSAIQVKDSSGNIVVPNQSNCTLNGHPFFCGTTPSLPSGSPATDAVADSYVRKALAVTKNRIIDSGEGVQKYGLVRDYKHGHLTVDYEIPDTSFTVSSLTGYNREQWSSLSDIVNYDGSGIANPTYTAANGQRSYYSAAYLVESVTKDWSQELRLSYDNAGPLRGVAGFSYLNSDNLRTVDSLDNIVANKQVTPSGKSETETLSGFFGITYDITSKLTASAEGRYQVDKLYSYIASTGDLTVTDSTFIPAGTYKAGSLLGSRDYTNFLPRFIVQYNWTDDLMSYISVAKGVNTAALNTGVAYYSGQTATVAKSLGVDLFVRPEKVTTYEFGIKGKALEGQMNFTAAAYYSQWRDQLNQVIQTFVLSGGGFGSVYGTINAGSTDMTGLELQGSYRLNHMITLNAAGAYTNSDVQKYNDPLVTNYSGISNFKGKELPNVSKYSATAGINFNGDFKSWGNATWFSRLDYSYKSGFWTDVANVVKTQDAHVFNFRTGITKGPVSVDFFVNNLFDNTSYVSANDGILFNPSSTYYNNATIRVGLREHRTLGLQMKYKF